eukprot:1156398-Pelagomonas_calceolata.AAC.11
MDEQEARHAAHFMTLRRRAKSGPIPCTYRELIKEQRRVLASAGACYLQSAADQLLSMYKTSGFWKKLPKQQDPAVAIYLYRTALRTIWAVHAWTCWYMFCLFFCPLLTCPCPSWLLLHWRQVIMDWCLEMLQPEPSWLKRVVLHNSKMRYPTRLWAELGADLHILKLGAPLHK